MMFRHTTIATMTILGAIVTLGFASSCKEGEPEEAASEEKEDSAAPPNRVTLSAEAIEPLRLTFATVEERELSHSLEVPAEVVPVPDRHAVVGPRVAGRVVDVRVNVGDDVEKGSTLVVLESDEVGRAWADWIAARARAAVAQRALERQRSLIEDGITSQRALQQAEGEQQVAEADLQAARTRLATYGITPSGPPPRNPARVPLTSPASGTVTMRSAHVGHWAEPSETLVEVVDLDELWIEAAVYERQMRLVQVGQPVGIELRAFPGEQFTGTVTQVEGSLNERTRSVAVRVVLPNPEHRLKPGMFGRVRIQSAATGERRRGLAVPSGSLLEIGGDTAVFVKEADGVFALRRVRPGERAGNFVEILTGLTAGTEVVVEGSSTLKAHLLRSTLGEDE